MISGRRRNWHEASDTTSPERTAAGKSCEDDRVASIRGCSTVGVVDEDDGCGSTTMQHQGSVGDQFNTRHVPYFAPMDDSAIDHRRKRPRRCVSPSWTIRTTSVWQRPLAVSATPFSSSACTTIQESDMDDCDDLPREITPQCDELSVVSAATVATTATATTTSSSLCTQWWKASTAKCKSRSASSFPSAASTLENGNGDNDVGSILSSATQTCGSALPSSSSSTSLPSAHSTTCIVCRKGIAQAPAKNDQQIPRQSTLLRFFSHTTKFAKATQSPYASPAPPSTKSMPTSSTSGDCHFCERSACSSCAHTCYMCEHAFCTFCCTQDYSGSGQTRTVCLDCKDSRTNALGDGNRDDKDAMEY